MALGKPLRVAYTNTLRLNSFYAKRVPYGNFDPLNSQYFKSNQKYHTLVSNEWGFFGNNNADAKRNVYPE